MPDRVAVRAVAALSLLLVLAGCRAGGTAIIESPTGLSRVPASAPPAPASPASAPPATPSPSPSPIPTPAQATTASPHSTPAPDLPPGAVPGTNVPGCRSSSPPIVLLHGTFSTVQSNFAGLVPKLLAAARCVYGLDYGNGGVATVAGSASAEAGFVGQVLAATGAAQVDVVGYSQGGLVLRTALRRDGLADRVALAVLVAPSFHGSDAPGLRSVPAQVCPACADQIAGSVLLTDLNRGGDLDGAVRYAVLSSEHDTVVTPWQSQAPAGPTARVHSATLEALCPGSAVPHEQLMGSAAVLRWVAAVLASDGRLPEAAAVCG